MASDLEAASRQRGGQRNDEVKRLPRGKVGPKDGCEAAGDYWSHIAGQVDNAA